MVAMHNEFLIDETLKAAGLPTDLNKILSREVSFTPYRGSEHHAFIIGITCHLGHIDLMLSVANGILRGTQKKLTCEYGNLECWPKNYEEPVSTTVVLL